MHYDNDPQLQKQGRWQTENNEQEQNPITGTNDSVTMYQQQLLQHQHQRLPLPSSSPPIAGKNILMGSTNINDFNVQQLLQQQQQSYAMNNTNTNTVNGYGSTSTTAAPYHDQQQQHSYTATDSPGPILSGHVAWMSQQQQTQQQVTTQLSQAQQPYGGNTAAPMTYQAIDGAVMTSNQNDGYHRQEQQFLDAEEEVFLDNAINDRSDDSICADGCCCCRCCQIRYAWNYLIHAENLHRAFCFGAIDGMLTGSGIAAASSGLGIFDPYGPLSSRLAIIGLAIASCTSDGLCMGIGHVWSTYVMHFTQNRERRRSQWTFQSHRSLAKARLVDMLLMRGVLKIDAMSIVDTLEGYPELFLSAMVGDANGGSGPLGTFPISMSRGSSLGSGGANSDPQQHQQQQECNTQDGNNHQQQQQQGYNPMDSYDSALMNYETFENENGYNASSLFSLTECQAEGFVMMFAFCLFSIVPSLVFAFVPIYINPNGEILPSGMSRDYYSNHGSYTGYLNNGTSAASSGTSAASVTLTITSFIMVLLGTWKSRFFSSSWVVFGIETVIVLILCIVSAYMLGSFLRYSIGIETIKVQTL